MFTDLTLDCLTAKPYGTRYQEVIARIEALGGIETRQVGSHRRFKAPYVDDDGTTRSAFTTVQIHKGKDIPPGTLRSIQKQMEPAFGKGWLL